jgi:hypothetical protein
MTRSLPKLDSVPWDHNVPVTTWTLLDNFNSDSVVGERTFLAQSSIVVRILNAGVFARITVSDGIGEVSENLGAREALIVQTSGLGERMAIPTNGR